MMHLFIRIAQGREMKMIKLKYWHIQLTILILRL